MPKPPPGSKGVYHEVIKRDPTVEGIQLADVAENSETIERFKQERLKWDDDTDVSYWVCLTFQSESQKLEFLSDPRFKDLRVMFHQYVDGEDFAERLGVKITPNVIPAKRDPLNKKLAAMVDLNKLHNPKKLSTKKKQG